MTQNNNRNRDGNRNRSRRRRKPSKSKAPQKKQTASPTDPFAKDSPPRKPVKKHIPKRYGVVFYDSHQAAKDDQSQLLEKAKEFDQLNIVIKAEGPMDDPELLQYGKLYAGAAGHRIHERRVEEGWYNEPR